MSNPTELRYTESHEWVRQNDDGSLTIGITDHAQEQLGDVVFVETPTVDLQCEAEQAIAVIESVKAASDIYAPVAGKISEVNADLLDSPELVNSSPFAEGWLFKMLPSDEDAWDALHSAEQYEAFISA